LKVGTLAVSGAYPHSEKQWMNEEWA
jgi:hypothetical protein